MRAAGQLGLFKTKHKANLAPQTCDNSTCEQRSVAGGDSGVRSTLTMHLIKRAKVLAAGSFCCRSCCSCGCLLMHLKHTAARRRGAEHAHTLVTTKFLWPQKGHQAAGQRCSAAPRGSLCDCLLPALHSGACLQMQKASFSWHVEITGDLLAFTRSLSINLLQISSCSVQVVPAELWLLHSSSEELRLAVSKKVFALIPCCVFVCASQKTAKISKKVAALAELEEFGNWRRLDAVRSLLL